MNDNEEVVSRLSDMVNDNEDFENRELREIISLLRDLKDSEHKELELARKQRIVTSVISAISLLIVVAVAFVVFSMLPEIRTMVKVANEMLVEVNDMMDEAESAINNLNKVSGELAEADLAGMITNVNKLVEQSQTGVAEAMEKVNSINIDKLNDAIDSLQTIIEPLSRLFKR